MARVKRLEVELPEGTPCSVCGTAKEEYDRPSECFALARVAYADDYLNESGIWPGMDEDGKPRGRNHFVVGDGVYTPVCDGCAISVMRNLLARDLDYAVDALHSTITTHEETVRALEAFLAQWADSHELIADDPTLPIRVFRDSTPPAPWEIRRVLLHLVSVSGTKLF